MIKKILKFKKNEYKYLSPHIYKDKKSQIWPSLLIISCTKINKKNYQR